MQFWILFWKAIQIPFIWGVIFLCSIPAVAAKQETPFPNILFKDFSKFVERNFSSSVTLATILMVLFTLSENTDLLSLHFRQRSAEHVTERSTAATGWIRSLGHAVLRRLDETEAALLMSADLNDDEEKMAIVIGLKLVSFAKELGLFPVSKKTGKFTGKLKPVSTKPIEPIHTICPNVAVCQTADCNRSALYQWTRQRDIPRVRLIKGSMAFDEVPVLAGHCKKCKTMYYADHERSALQNGEGHERVYLNSAKYIKIGQSLWADRLFTSAVISGMYNFHASAAAYTEYWNDAFKSMGSAGQVSRRHIWQAFVQESIRSIASDHNIDLTIQDGLSIDEVTREAFKYLGDNGTIHAADRHACSECTHQYRGPDPFLINVEPGAVLGMEEVNPDQIHQVVQEDVNMEDPEHAPVKMIVLDGIVMGHTVSVVT